MGKSTTNGVFSIAMLNYQGTLNTIPICSMYGIFTNIYLINDPNVGKYTIHGTYGYRLSTRISPRIRWRVDACARAALTAGVDQEKCHVTDPMETLPWDLWDDYNGTVTGF